MNPSVHFTLPDWARAGGPVAASARMRVTPDDFQVDEDLGFEPSGDGQHDFLLVEKVDQGTDRVAGMLARFAGVPRRAVSYSGMKDRRARTRQWFSVERPLKRDMNWADFNAEGVVIAAAHQNRRKLRRGAHRGNRFRITLRHLVDTGNSVEQRLERIAGQGVPNYFGEQRFGHDGGNVELARRVFAGERVPRHLRSIAISAARSLIFNDVLSARVAQNSWDRLVDGDIANLDGSGSLFAISAPDAELEARCRAFDIHPTGPLWGRNAPASGLAVAELERAAAEARADLRDGLEGIAEEGRRTLRLKVDDLAWERSEDQLRLSFALTSGAFATAVLREVLDATL